MIRNIIAVILGFIVAWVLFTLIQGATHFVFPTAPLDTNNMESIKAYMASITPAMFAVVLIGYAIGSFAAGLVIGKVAESKTNVVPIIVGALLTIGWILNLVMLPHPIWVAIIGFFMFIPFTVLGKNVSVASGSDGEAGVAAAGAEASGEGDGDSMEAEAGASVPREEE